MIIRTNKKRFGYGSCGTYETNVNPLTGEVDNNHLFEVFVSYSTIVATKHKYDYVFVSHKYSPTTSRQITKWCGISSAKRQNYPNVPMGKPAYYDFSLRTKWY